MTPAQLADAVLAATAAALTARGLDPAVLPRTASVERPRIPEHGDYASTLALQVGKKVGVTSQREMENAVREAIASGRLKGHEKLSAKMVLTLGDVGLTHEISDEIELG